MESLQKSLSESVPASSLEEANREFADLTSKYRDLLQREQVKGTIQKLRDVYQSTDSLCSTTKLS